MATTEELVIKVSAEIGQLREDMDKVKRSIADVGDETVDTESKTNKFVKSMIPSWKTVAATAVAAAAAIGAAGIKIIDIAADAEATTQKFNTVFKEYSAGAQQWADDFSESVGRSRVDVMAWAASVQDTLVPMGYSREEATKLSEQLVQMGVDLGSFYDMADSDVMEKITSGLVGNTENWREWGVVASESAIKQELLNMLGEEGAKTATEAQKVQARLNILIKGTADAQGQAAREADQYQNQMKTFFGNIKDMAAEAGSSAMESLAVVFKDVNTMMADGGSEAVVMVFSEMAGAISWTAEVALDAANAFKTWGNNGGFDSIRDFADNTLRNLTDMLGSSYEALQEFVGRGGLERLGEAARVVIDEITTVNRILGEIGVYKAFGAVIGAIVTGLLGFAEGVAYTITEFNKFKRAIITTVADVLDAIGTIVPGADDMAAGLRRSLDSVETTAQTTSTNVSSEFAKMYNSVDGTMSGFPAVVVNPLNATASPARTAANGIGTNANSGLIIGMSGMPASASSVMGKVSSTITASGPSLASAASSAGNRAVTAIEASFARVQSVLGNIKSAFDSATYYSSRMPSSGHGGSSSSTGSTGVVSQGGRGTGESSVRIVEAHATGGIASYTGLHHLERGEVTVPPQFDWNARVVNPIVNALNSSRTGNRNVTINVNNSTDVKNLQKTITKSVQRGVNGTTVVV